MGGTKSLRLRTSELEYMGGCFEYRDDSSIRLSRTKSVQLSRSHTKSALSRVSPKGGSCANTPTQSSEWRTPPLQNAL